MTVHISDYIETKIIYYANQSDNPKIYTKVIFLIINPYECEIMQISPSDYSEATTLRAYYCNQYRYIPRIAANVITVHTVNTLSL